MLISLSFKKEHLWLRVLSVNDERETVAGRVFNHPFNRGLKFGHNIEIPIDEIYVILYKDKNVIYSYNVR